MKALTGSGMDAIARSVGRLKVSATKRPRKSSHGCEGHVWAGFTLFFLFGLGGAARRNKTGNFQMKAEVIQGDCLIEMPELAERGIVFDAVIADTPFGTTACKWDSVIPFAPMWANLKRLVKRNGAIVLFGSQPFTSALVMSNPAWFRHEWVWVKNRGSNFLNTVREPMKEHESVLCFSEGDWTYNPQMQDRTGNGLNLIGRSVPCRTNSPNYGSVAGYDSILPEKRQPSSWQKFNTEVGLHPTQKPVELMRYLVRTYTNEGDTVLDFTCGSGTTGVACVIEKRNFIGIEKDKHDADVARARIKRAQGIACDIPRLVKKDAPLPLFAVNE